MKTIVKELIALEISDIEKAVSDFMECPVKISEMDCSITYWIDDNDQPVEMFLDFGCCDANDLFCDEEKKGFYLNGVRLSVSEPWLPLNEIFAFDVSEFRRFTFWSDLASRYD